MNTRRFLLARTAWLFVGVWAVLTLTFLFVVLTPDPNLAVVRWYAVRAGNPGAVDAYVAANHLDLPLYERYVVWLREMASLDLGTTFLGDEPGSGGTSVLVSVLSALATTAVYLVPGMALATGIGVGLGTLSGMKPGSWVDALVRGVSYFGLGIPHFYVAGVLWVYVGAFKFGAARWLRFTAAALILAVTMLAAQTRYTRAELREYASTDFVKLVRAKGAPPWRVARHLLRNAALPLLTLFVAELLSVLVLTAIVVEDAFMIDGIGSLALTAMESRDVPLITGVVLVVSVLGLVGNFLQDVLYAVLDPRIDLEE